LVEALFEQYFFSVSAYMRGVSLMNPEIVAVETPARSAIIFNHARYIWVFFITTALSFIYSCVIDHLVNFI